MSHESFKKENFDEDVEIAKKDFSLTEKALKFLKGGRGGDAEKIKVNAEKGLLEKNPEKEEEIKEGIG